MNPFIVTITYNPQKPTLAKIDIVPSSDEHPRLDDVIASLRIAYERMLMEKGAQLIVGNSGTDRELNHETAV